MYIQLGKQAVEFFLSEIQSANKNNMPLVEALCFYLEIIKAEETKD